MTVSSGYAPNSSTGNGVTTVFAYNFRILAAADLEVTVDGVVQTLNVDYTVTGVGDGSGGSITFTAAPADGANVIRRRNMALTRATDYQDNGDLLADVLNPDQDAPVMMLQQLAEQVDRSIKMPLGDAAPSEVPDAEDRANKYLMFDANGNLSTSTGTGTDAGLRGDLAASSGASLVGFLPAGAGAVATTTEAALRKYPHPSQYAANADYVAACQALATGQHWTQNGAIIHRLADRLFVGGAIDNDGALPNVQKDWMATYQVAAGLGNGSTASATSVALTSTAAASNIAHLAGAQSKYATGANQSTIGVFGFALNNHATLATRVWGGYFEAHKETAAGTGARGIEVDVRVVSATAEINPYPNQQTTTSALQLGAGCELAAAGQQNVGAVIQIVDNPMQFRKGIVFGANSLEGSDGASGYGTAVAMAAYQGIDWYSNANVLVGRISAATTTAGGELRFTSTGPLILGQNGLSVARFADTAGAANNLQFAAAATGGAPQIVATGTDANVDLRLTTTGTGVVRFGTMTANADAPITGYISIKDSGGTARKLAVIA